MPRASFTRRAPGLVATLLVAGTLAGAAGCAPPEASEGPDVLTGRVQRLVADRGPGGTSRTIVLLESGDRTTELWFPGAAALATGTELRVHGRFAARGTDDVRFGTTAPFAVARHEVLAADAPDQHALIFDPSRAPAPRRLAVVLLNFVNDDRQPITVEEARRRIFTAPDSTRAFYKEQSYGLVDLVGKNGAQGEVFGWYTIASANRPCAVDEWGKAGAAAAKTAGVDLEGYDHIVFFFPATDACPYLGLGQQPGKNTWINGASIATFNHELGHNLGTPHAGAKACRGTGGVRVTLSESCADSEYGNPFDVMGAAFRHTHAYNKAQARWLSGPNLQEADKDGVYTLLPQEKPSNGVQLLSIRRDETTFYHLEYRQPFGAFDNFAPTDPAVNGLIVVIGRGTRQFGQSTLLDMAPETTTFEDAPLALGKTFEDGKAGVKITFLERTPEAAKVKVELRPLPSLDAGARADGGADAGADAGTRPDATAEVAITPASGPREDVPVHALPPAPRARESGCAYGGAAPAGAWLPLGLVGLGLVLRRRRRLPGALLLLVCAGLTLASGCGESADPIVPTVNGGSGGRGGAGGSGGGGGDAGGGASDADAAQDLGRDGNGEDGERDAGFGDDAPPPAEILLYPVPDDVAAACREYGIAYCERRQTCVPEVFARDYGDLALCQARRERACRTDFLVPGRGELPSHRAACTAGITMQTCSALLEGRGVPGCDPPPGKLERGGACFLHSQCASGLRCKIDADVCGTCQPALAVGADCGWWSGGCPPGTGCYDDRCLAPRKLGETCKTSPAPCAAGLACSATGCVAATAPVGTACGPVDACDVGKGLYCNLMTRACAAQPPAAGIDQPCWTYDATGAWLTCGPDATCFSASSAVTAMRKCVARVKLGEKCDPGTGKECQAPATCARGVCVMPVVKTGGSYTPPACR